MNTLKKIIPITILICMHFTSFAQIPESLEKGRVSKSDGTQIEFQSLALHDGVYLVKTKNETHELSPDNILRLERQTGNESLLWGASLGGAALLGGLLGVNRAESTTGIEADSDSKTAIVAGLTGLGVAIGVLVGSKQKKYETVYNASDAQKSHWNLNFKAFPNSTGLSVSYTF